MKYHKTYELEDKNYTKSLSNEIDLNSPSAIGSNRNREIIRLAGVTRMFYQGDIYQCWKNLQSNDPSQSLYHGDKDTIEKKHLENIRHRLEQRLKIARAKNDERLIFILEKEKQLI